jgi:TnpA family transposase
MTTAKSERLAVLTPAEQDALYGLPDFDDSQRLEYLGLTEAELSLASRRAGLHYQAWCVLQIGYFKAKQTFFRFTWDDVPEDLAFVLSRYFPGEAFEPRPISTREHYAQRALIAQLSNYRLWSNEFQDHLIQQAEQLARRDVTPAFIVTELVDYLRKFKVERPGYTTMQTVIGQALSTERLRLADVLSSVLDAATTLSLAKLLVHDDTLSELAALKQDAKSFGWHQMMREREKRDRLEPLYLAAKAVLPLLAISQQNLHHYASLANFYTVYDLRRMKPEQANLYLLCYAWQRFRQFTDNMIDAAGFHTKQFEELTKELAEEAFIAQQLKRQKESPRLGRLLLLYVDDAYTDATPFGTVPRRAFKIMPRAKLQLAGERMSTRPSTQLTLRWEAVDKLGPRVRRHLRPLYETLEPTAVDPANPWLAALVWMKGVFAKQQSLSQRPADEIPEGTVPTRLRSYLLTFDADDTPTGVQADRFEFWVYRQLRRRFRSGDIYVDDSQQHRHLSAELVSADRQASAFELLDIPWTRKPLVEQLSELTAELHGQWLAFDSELRAGQLAHLDYDEASSTLTCRRPKAEDDGEQDAFYDQLPFCDVADVLRFVNQECDFMSALTPLQPRYAKQGADQNSLLAVITAQAMNHGNFLMSKTSDITYRVLETTHQQYLRLATLQAANDRISNAISELPIFPHYSFDLETLYASVDGQKFGVERPTLKARHSRKYFGRGKGMVAYTLLCNHVPLQGWLIGAHELEAHHIFDIWYRNTSNIVPTAITGDMHSLNKVNFAILAWFGPRYEPRFTDLDKQIKDIYCAGDPTQYAHCLVQPAGQVDLAAIVSEKGNIDRIVATLALKEMTQGTLVRKLCTYEDDPTHDAVFEYDKLVRSIYTLRYLRDPLLQRHMHRSQNRIESYHQLRSAIAQVGGKKELTGSTGLDVEVSNQCARLIANAIVFYNSAILSRLLTLYTATGNEAALALIRSTSPVAWRHVQLNGRYVFRDGQAIDLEAIIRGLNL